MKLTDNRFGIWCVIAALMPVMMSVFAALILIGVESASELFYYKNLEIFLIWEITYLLGGFLSYPKLQSNGWIRSSFICWGMTSRFLSFFRSYGLESGYMTDLQDFITS